MRSSKPFRALLPDGEDDSESARRTREAIHLLAARQAMKLKEQAESSKPEMPLEEQITEAMQIASRQF